MTPVDSPLARRAARIALEHQGLLGAAPFGRGVAGAERALTAIGYVQIDTISVVARAHHHAFWSRVPTFRPEHLDALVASRRAFEYWAHAAAYLPIADYRFALARMQETKIRLKHRLRGKERKLLTVILDRIRAEGPLRARDFETPRRKRTGWWDWKPAKRGLEQLFFQGDLMASGRDGFEKVYDLPERVLPSDVDTRLPTIDEWADHAIDSTLRAHGFATAPSLTYGRKNAELRKAVKRSLAARVAERRLEVRTLGDGFVVYGEPQAFARAPRAPKSRVKLLSPFDNAIIDRNRALALHAFDYQIECYVPQEKRRFGYFCLPMLYADRFVGRVDAKADRESKVLRLKHVHVESEPDDAEAFASALHAEARAYAAFNGCDDVAVERVSPKRWQQPIAAQFRG